MEREQGYEIESTFFDAEGRRITTKENAGVGSKMLKNGETVEIPARSIDEQSMAKLPVEKRGKLLNAYKNRLTKLAIAKDEQQIGE